MLGLLLVAAAAAFFLHLLHAYPAGQGPFDHLPSGYVKAGASKPTVVTASSGRSYRTYTWPPNGGAQLFHVAERTDAPAWIAYWSTQGSDSRQLYGLRTPYATGSAADATEAAALKRDFGV